MSEMAATISRSRAIVILEGIARDEGNDVADRIYALQVLKKMHGWNSPLAVELSASGLQRILGLLARPAHDAPQRMRPAIPALENGAGH